MTEPNAYLTIRFEGPDQKGAFAGPSGYDRILLTVTRDRSSSLPPIATCLSKQLSRQAGRIDEIRSELLRTQALAQSSGASSQLLLRLQHFIGTAGQMIDDIHSEAARIVNQQNRLAEEQGLVDDARGRGKPAHYQRPCASSIPGHLRPWTVEL